jgi:hypothetical protein
MRLSRNFAVVVALGASALQGVAAEALTTDRQALAAYCFAAADAAVRQNEGKLAAPTAGATPLERSLNARSAEVFKETQSRRERLRAYLEIVPTMRQIVAALHYGRQGFAVRGQAVRQFVDDMTSGRIAGDPASSPDDPMKINPACQRTQRCYAPDLIPY